MQHDFDESAHQHSLVTPSGRIFMPSVTQVLEDVGIVDFSKVPPETRRRALDRGRIVHLCARYDAELELQGQQLADDQIDESVYGYVMAARSFRREKRFVADQIEIGSYHAQLLYGGTPDLVGHFEGEAAPTLIDYKTGAASEWVRYQTAAYVAFLRNPRLYRRVCVELHEDATYAVRFVREGRHFQEDYNVFISALNSFRVRHPNYGETGLRRAA
jgi:hypothetical protein